MELATLLLPIIICLHLLLLLIRVAYLSDLFDRFLSLVLGVFGQFYEPLDFIAYRLILLSHSIFDHVHFLGYLASYQLANFFRDLTIAINLLLLLTRKCNLLKVEARSIRLLWGVTHRGKCSVIRSYTLICCCLEIRLLCGRDAAKFRCLVFLVRRLDRDKLVRSSILSIILPNEHIIAVGGLLSDFNLSLFLSHHPTPVLFPTLLFFSLPLGCFLAFSLLFSHEIESCKSSILIFILQFFLISLFT